MSDILVIIEESLSKHLKGSIIVTYDNGIIRAQLTNDFLQYPLTVSFNVPHEHLFISAAQQNIADNLYQKLRHMIEKNIFKWYD